jgi:superfamily II DNA or RNA helicase
MPGVKGEKPSCVALNTGASLPAAIMPRALLGVSPLLRRFEPLFSPTVRVRGLDYATRGRVTIADATDAWLVAHVEGTSLYEVELDLQRGSLHVRCDCPHFSGSAEPCKHAWATLLVSSEQDALPRLAEVRALVFDFDDAAGDGEGDDDIDDDDPWETRARAPVVVPRRLPGPRTAASWRDVLADAGARSPGLLPRRRELRYVVDPEHTRARGRLVVRPVERHGQPPNATWRPAQIGRPFVQSVGVDDVVMLGILDAFSPVPGWYGGRAVAEFDVPVESSKEILERLCASGRAHLGDPDGPALRWDAQPYVLALEACARERGAGLNVRAWLERGEERVASTEPALVLAGGLALWPERVAPIDDGGQFAWIFNERSRGPAALPAREVDDFLEALHRAPHPPRLRLPPEHALPEVHVPGQPYALLRTTRDVLAATGGVAVDAGLDYDGVRAPLETHGRALVDRARRRLIVRDAAAEQQAREQLEATGARPLVQWHRTDSRGSVAWRLAAGRLEQAVRALVAGGWRVEVDGRLRRSGGDFALQVSTEIDWLDVHVQARFDGVEAPMPELLAALKHKRRTVTLADGSVGELSDGALDKLRRWAGMADTSGGGLRFRKVQTALVAALLDGEPGASFDEAFSKARAELDAFVGVTPRDPPRTLRGTLRDYQRHGLGWFEALRRFGFGGCLADDMGLGKTVQVLAMLDARRQERPRPGPSLVVAPRSVLANWASEAARFTPKLRVLLHDGTDRKTPGDHFAEHDLVLTTYGLLRHDALALARVDFDYVALDEAQAIKTARTASAKAARALRSRHRLALTGTPLENHLGELASLLDFLNPGVLGTAGALASLAQGSRRVDPETRDLLARAVRPFFLRRTKREVAPELPDRVEQKVECQLPTEQRRLYDELHVHYRESLKRRVARRGVAQSTAHILEALLRLRQAACHPGLIDPARRGEPSAKLDVLLEHLDTVKAQGQKALVFSQFTSLLSIVRDRLDERGITYEYLDGATRDRPARIERFQSDERCQVFLLSLKAGGVGLNLTAAEYVFLLDPWWNPAVEAQAIDCAHRIGQTRTVFAYKLLAAGTVEEKVAQLQEQKRELADALFGGGGAALTGLTREDLELLLA